MKQVVTVAAALLASVLMFFVIASAYDIRVAENAWFAVFCSILSGFFSAAFTSFVLNADGAYTF